MADLVTYHNLRMSACAVTSLTGVWVEQVTL